MVFKSCGIEIFRVNVWCVIRNRQGSDHKSQNFVATQKPKWNITYLVLFPINFKHWYTVFSVYFITRWMSPNTLCLKHELKTLSTQIFQFGKFLGQCCTQIYSWFLVKQNLKISKQFENTLFSKLWLKTKKKKRKINK